MGVVFEARQISLNRPVALKMILAGQLADETDVKRFYTEAEAAANLDHPGIVPIYEVGQHEGQHFFSMAFVEGRSLAHRLADGPMPARCGGVVARIGQGDRVCPPSRRDPSRPEAGQHPPRRRRPPAGDRLRAGQAGAARRRADRIGPDHGNAQLHAAGASRRQSGEVGPAADVYALGATLYALITGRPPFQAATAMDTVLQVLSDEPVAPRRLNASMPRDLETIV